MGRVVWQGSHRKNAGQEQLHLLRPALFSSTPAIPPPGVARQLYGVGKVAIAYTIQLLICLGAQQFHLSSYPPHKRQLVLLRPVSIANLFAGMKAVAVLKRGKALQSNEELEERSGYTACFTPLTSFQVWNRPCKRAGIPLHVSDASVVGNTQRWDQRQRESVVPVLLI
jgi:hypothetical protein